MTILIIGGTGNISRWLVQELARRGESVTIYNRGNRNMTFEGEVRQVTGDRTKRVEFERQVRELGRFDGVVDMVGYEPEDARAAVKAFAGQTGHFIFCSTVDVYTKLPPSYPVNENTAQQASASFQYAYKKMQMEKIFSDASLSQSFPLTILQPAATYSERWSPLVTCFGGQTYHLDRLRRGKEMILHGDGMGIWNATHAIDVANAFANAIGNKHVLGKKYIVAGDEWITWKQMHETVTNLLEAPEPKFAYIPTSVLHQLAPQESEWCKENFQYNNIFDNSAAKKDLQFRYTISFEEGARRCIDHLLKHGGIDDADTAPFYDRLIDRWKQTLTTLNTVQ